MQSSSTIERELLALENKFWKAIQDKDVESALSMTHDPCIVTGAQGVAKLSLEEFRGMMGNETYTLDRFELKDTKVTRLTDDVAVIAYSVHEELTLEGKPIAIDASESSTWVRRDGRWVCAQHSESLLGDSFGRDRRPFNASEPAGTH
jgi:ketosteroid isomerase-like protein